VRKLSRDIPSASWVGVARTISRVEWEHRRKARSETLHALPEPSGERDLVGRVALVTGSARRLGRALAEHLASRGANVAIHYHASRSEAEAVVAELRGRHPDAKFEAFACALHDRAQVRALPEAIERSLGPIDVLVNNVGHYVPKGVLELEEDEWDTTLRTNLDAAFHLTRAVVDRILARGTRWGRVVNIGQAGAYEVLARPMSSAYHVSKTALTVLTKTFADACGPHGITVNQLNPGILEISVDLPVEVDRAIPLRRLGTIADVVNGLAYLTSPQAAYVTGAALDVCGGYGLAGLP
jgi:NAD(P)-dependent dehydrogenase (short-subunit alcohol dehydrogenase family)